MKAFAFSIAALLALASPSKAEEEPYVYDGRICYQFDYMVCAIAAKCVWDDRKDARSEFGFIGPHCRSERPLSAEAAASVRRKIASKAQ